MNQQRQVVYDIRNQALEGENLKELVYQIIDDFILDEVDLQKSNGTPDAWEWEKLRQHISSHIMVDAYLKRYSKS